MSRNGVPKLQNTYLGSDMLSMLSLVHSLSPLSSVFFNTKPLTRPRRLGNLSRGSVRQVESERQKYGMRGLKARNDKISQTFLPLKSLSGDTSGSPSSAAHRTSRLPHPSRLFLEVLSWSPPHHSQAHGTRSNRDKANKAQWSRRCKTK